MFNQPVSRWSESRVRKVDFQGAAADTEGGRRNHADVHEPSVTSAFAGPVKERNPPQGGGVPAIRLPWSGRSSMRARMPKIDRELQVDLRSATKGQEGSPTVNDVVAGRIRGQRDANGSPGGGRMRASR